MKTCKRCGLRKNIESYHRHPGTYDGYNNICKSCKKVADSHYANTATRAIRRKEWQRHNPDKVAEYRKRSKVKRKEQQGTKFASPSIRLFYECCPPGMEVDHVIPLSRGGKHELANLQWLTPAENKKKWAKVPVYYKDHYEWERREEKNT